MIEENEFVKLYESGMTYREIADHKGISIHVSKGLGKKYKITARKPGVRRTDLTGKVFGELTVVAYDSTTQTYNCTCSCGTSVNRDSSSLTGGEGQKMCWDCRNNYISTIKWKGHGEIGMDKWLAITNSASVRNLEFSVTIEQVWDLFLKQNRLCALSGLPLTFHSRKEDRAKTTASLDRIDSTKGYTLDNVQWVHKIINNIKMNLPEDKFIHMCKLVAAHNP